jgi:hypothetical protein
MDYTAMSVSSFCIVDACKSVLQQFGPNTFWCLTTMATKIVIVSFERRFEIIYKSCFKFFISSSRLEIFLLKEISCPPTFLISLTIVLMTSGVGLAVQN